MIDVCGDCLPISQFGVTRRRALGLLGGAVMAAHLRPARLSAAPVEVAPGLMIRPRNDWADGRVPTGRLAPENDVRFLLVHHTASANGTDPITVMRTAYNFHTGPEKGWPDVAYNFFVDQFGEVWEAREGSLAGPVEASATGGSQGFAQLVCLLGDFTSVLPTPEALASLTATLAWLADRSQIDTRLGTTTQFVSRGSNRWSAGDNVVAQTISGHRDMSQTACPGDTFYPYLIANIAADVTALRTAGMAASTTVAPTTAAPTTVAPTTAEPTTTTPTAAAPTTSSMPRADESAGPVDTSVSSMGSAAPTFDTSASASDSDAGPGSAMLIPGGLAVAALGATAVAVVARRRSLNQTIDRSAGAQQHDR